MRYRSGWTEAARWLTASLLTLLILICEGLTASSEEGATLVFRKRNIEFTGLLSKRQAGLEPLPWLRTSLDGVPIATTTVSLAPGPRELRLEGPESMAASPQTGQWSTRTMAGTFTTTEHAPGVYKPGNLVLLRFDAEAGHVYECAWDWDFDQLPTLTVWVKDKEAKGKAKKRKGRLAEGLIVFVKHE